MDCTYVLLHPNDLIQWITILRVIQLFKMFGGKTFSTALSLYFLYQRTHPPLANDVQYRIKRLENT
jgi:hypothetical protein